MFISVKWIKYGIYRKNQSVYVCLLLLLTATQFAYGGRKSALPKAPLAVEKRITKLADDLAAYTSDRTNSAVPINKIRNCQQFLTAAVSELPLSQPEKGSNSREISRFTWERIPISDILSGVGWYSLGIGFGGSLALPLITPDAWHANISQIGDFLLNRGWNMVLASFLWELGLPDPAIPIPTGLNSNSGQTANDTASIADIIFIQDIFINRLAQHGLRPPGYIEPRLWIQALANGLTQESLESPTVLLQEVVLLERRITQNILPLLHDSILIDEANRLSMELTTSEELKFGLLSNIRKKRWLADAIKRFVSVLVRANALQERINTQESQDKFQNLIRFANDDSRKFYFACGSVFYGLTLFEDFLKRVETAGQGGIEISVGNFQLITQPNREMGVQGIASLEVTLNLQEGEKISKKTIKVQIRTNETTLTDLLERDRNLPFLVAEPITDILTEFKIGMLSTGSSDVDALSTEPTPEETTPKTPRKREKRTKE